jgi:ATP-dependent RNA helicase DDX47/RRP3
MKKELSGQKFKNNKSEEKKKVVQEEVEEDFDFNNLIGGKNNNQSDSESESESNKLTKKENSKKTNNSIVEGNNAEESNILSDLYDKTTTFKELGVCEELCEVLDKLGYKHPSKIQKETLQYALQGRDLIGLAETGSGKTAAFGIPIIQKLLLEEPRPFYACVLAPTRELCLQINQHFEALGSAIGLKTCVLVGGLDTVSQAIALSKNPHIIIGTPGRIIDHLSHTKGFNLKHLKFLVFDEADRLLDFDFEKEIHQLLSVIPKNRTTFLFSATMTSKVHKLQKASLIDPVKIEVNSKYTTVSTLVQNYLFIPLKYKETYLAYLLNQYAGNTVIIFVATCLGSIK